LTIDAHLHHEYTPLSLKKQERERSLYPNCARGEAIVDDQYTRRSSRRVPTAPTLQFLPPEPSPEPYETVIRSPNLAIAVSLSNQHFTVFPFGLIILEQLAQKVQRVFEVLGSVLSKLRLSLQSVPRRCLRALNSAWK
jgi:hypothetical protein